MDMKMKLGIGAVFVAGLGIGAIGLLVKNGGEAFGELAVVEGVAAEAVEPAETTKAKKDFQSMAVIAEDVVECSLPKVPKSIGETALTRNSLRQILRIVALEKWQKTGSCDCLTRETSWDDVVKAAPDFERADGVDLRFDLSDLRSKADDLEAQRLKVCAD